MCSLQELISLTSVKERDVVILDRTEVHILPKICLLGGVRCQKALSMESLLLVWDVKGTVSVWHKEGL